MARSGSRSSSVSPTTVNTGTTSLTSSGDRPPLAAPSATAGSSIVSMYVREWRGWTWMPSATSPAIRTIHGPTAAT